MNAILVSAWSLEGLTQRLRVAGYCVGIALPLRHKCQLAPAKWGFREALLDSRLPKNEGPTD
jgi:hypothetical protein